MPESSTRNDPVLAFRFRVRINDVLVAGFSECSGLQLETEIHEHAEGGLNEYMLKFPTRTKQSNLTFKRGIVDRDLYTWYEDLVRGDVVLKDGSISILDEAGDAPIAEWEFQQSFPLKWIGPDLNATQSSVAVETFEICYRSLVRRV